MSTDAFYFDEFLNVVIEAGKARFGRCFTAEGGEFGRHFWQSIALEFVFGDELEYFLIEGEEIRVPFFEND